jgi:tetratricopeptide (TPR) repeat protein
MVLEPTFSTLYDQWEAISSEGKWSEALAFCDGLFASARQSQRPAFFLKAKKARGISAFWCGHFQTAQQDLRETIDIPSSHSDLLQSHGGASTLSVCQAYLSLVLALSLESKQAFDFHHSSPDLAKMSENPLIIAQVMAAESFFHRLRREIAPTLRHANLLKDHCREHGLRFWYSQAGILSGWAKSLSGDEEEGLREMEKHLEELSGGNFDLLALLSISEGFHLSGEVDQAISFLDRAILRSSETGDRVLLSEMWRLMAELLSVKGRPEVEVLQAFERAISIAGENPAPLFEVRATLCLDRWEKNRGRSNPLTGMSLLRLSSAYREMLPESDLSDLDRATFSPGGEESP